MTFVQNGRPDPDTKEEILSFLVAVAEETMGEKFTPDEVSVMRAHYEPIAAYCASQQNDLADVLDSVQIDHAEGQALDLLGALIGVSRREAAPAATRLQFSHDTPVGRDYSIPAGTSAQTDDADAIRFETEEFTTLPYIDGFEDGDISEYNGDTGDYNVQASTVHTGSNALEANAANSSIANIDIEIEEGTRFHYKTWLQGTTVGAFLFGVDTLADTYKFVLDENASEARFVVVEGGTETVLGSVSTTIPYGEWLDVQVDWNHDGEFEATVENSSGSEVLNLTASEPTGTYSVGGIGFGSEDTNGRKYFDEVTTSHVSTDAVATSSGADTNVGSNVVTVMSNTVSGIDSVTNPLPASGGRDRENDEDFRVRARDEPGSTLRATLKALIDRLDSLDATRTVTVIDNDSNGTDAAGRPPHSFEAIVDVDSNSYEEVAETIVETKAVGDTSVGGYAGDSVTRTIRLSNGQDKDITFSTPSQVKIYVDVDLVKTDTYAGDAAVRDSIVQYIGGTVSSENNVDGELGAGDDVVYYQILEAVMDVEGVHDVSSLSVGKSSSPTGTSNISITNNETANADSTDDTITLATSDK